MNYLLTESLANTVVVYMIIKQLSLPFEEWDAFELGIIDDEGNKIKKPRSSKERKAWTVFDRFIANIKKILSKFVGPSRFGAIVTAAYLLRDSQVPLLNKNLLTESNDSVDLTANMQLQIKQLMNETNIEPYDTGNAMFLLFMVEKNMSKFLEKDLDFLKMGEFDV